MGHKQSRTTDNIPSSSGETSFKLFEYQCSKCRAKRPIQYFHRNGKFLPQTPRVVCGECNTSVVVEPFKTVEYGCPACKRWQKVRLPARPLPLNMYNVSVVSCNCGYKGEATVGRLMDVACCQCWQHRRELCEVWTEDGDEFKHFCEHCQDYKRCIARGPKKKGEEPTADLEFECQGCQEICPVQTEELLRTSGHASCQSCNWTGYPEVRPMGRLEKRRRPPSETSKQGTQQAFSSRKKDSASNQPKTRSSRIRPDPNELSSIVPEPSNGRSSGSLDV
mmetsp:Transcript_13863/g.30580  ORF Transcript_13863/g.30580 Transcript_13863/m.30580 type:complete len:278 (+) Transcript_13863:51-884(+)